VLGSKWESSAAFHLEQHPRVAAFVKNDGLGFTIPYLSGGGQHEYVPDFLVRLDNGEWRYAICRDMNTIPAVIDEAARAPIRTTPSLGD
jgi:type III restriction enzyme